MPRQSYEGDRQTIDYSPMPSGNELMLYQTRKQEIKHLVVEQKDQIIQCEGSFKDGHEIDKDLEYLDRIAKLEAELQELKTLKGTDEALMAGLQTINRDAIGSVALLKTETDSLIIEQKALITQKD